MEGLAWDGAQREENVLCRIVCESAAVAVATHPTGNGLRLRLTSERSGSSVLLDATVLDALCTLAPEQIAELVRVATEGGGAA